MSERPEASSTLAEAVRSACVDAAIQAYEDAGLRGLCPDGRWEAAVAAVRQLDLARVIEPAGGSASRDPGTTCR